MKAVGEENISLEEREDCLILNMYPLFGFRAMAMSKCCLIYVLLPELLLGPILCGAATTTIVVYKTGRVTAEYKTNLYSYWYDFKNVASLSTYEGAAANDDGTDVDILLSVNFKDRTSARTQIPVVERSPNAFYHISRYLQENHIVMAEVAPVPYAEVVAGLEGDGRGL